MKDNLKNVINLSKLYILENDVNLKIINFEKKKINKKSALFWVYVVLIFGILYVSSEVISFVAKTGKPEIFINGFLLFMEILIIIRTIMVSMNVFYFSKEIENILHLPIKPIEILVSKFNTILFMNYELELLFAFIPLLIYVNYANVGISYFFNLILILIVFPIFASLVVSIIMIALMKTIRLFKNKDLMQIVISFVLIFVIMFASGKVLKYVFNNAEYIEENQEVILNNINEKIIKINNYFLIINPSRNILLKTGFFNKLFNYLKLIIINISAFLLFAFLGNKLYLKQLLKANFYIKKKKEKEIKLSKKIKKNNIGFSYIKKEFELILKNPIFFIQSVYPVIITTIMICVLISVLVPAFNEMLQKDEYKEALEGLSFNMEAVCIILGISQITGLFNYTSITAFSREGQNAFIIKTLPISLYKQYIYKNIPQIIINSICTFAILVTTKIKIPIIELKYIIIMFLLSSILSISNSFTLSLIDLLMPKLKWDAEYEILKNNKNKLLQYALIVFNVIFLIFINNLFKKHNFDISLGIFAIFLIFVSVIFGLIINKYKNRLFKKIN